MASGFSLFKNAVTATSLRHARVHQGTFYSADHFDSALVNGGTIDLLVQIGEFEAHLRHFSSSGGQGELRIFEGTTFSAAGTAVNAVNRNREVLRPATTVITLDPTITLVGTQLDVLFVPGGAGGNASGNFADFEMEWLLAPNTDYLVRFTNTAGTTQPAHVHLEWYEDLEG